MTWLGSTVSGHDSQSFLTGFILSRSVLKTMAPVWNMASIPSESVKSSLASSSHSSLSPQNPLPLAPLSRLALTVKGLVTPSRHFFNRRSQRRNSPLWLKRSQLSCKQMKLHAGKMTLITIQAKKKKKLHIRTPRSHKHMHVPVSAPVCQETLEMNSLIKTK